MRRFLSRSAAVLAVLSFVGYAAGLHSASAADVATDAATRSTTAPGKSLLVTLPYPQSSTPAKGKDIRWKKTVLDEKFRGEGVAVGDFNHDGKMDIAVGPVYYAAPDWKMHSMTDKAGEFDPHNYSESFLCYADDLNHDGWTDLIVVGFPGHETFWYENPKGASGPWPKHLISPVSSNESPNYVDIDGSGQRALVMAVAPDEPHCDGPDRFMAILRPGKDPTKPWDQQQISTKAAPGTNRFSHGLGVGSIQGNGRNDVLVREGWWESPADKSRSAPWLFHAVNFGAPCSHMLVYDFNGDGKNDVLSASAHEYGIWLHEQQPDGTFKTREIDKSFSETHSTVLCDISGDGLPGFVTGKRWWSHGPGGPGAGEPAYLYWFQPVRKDSKVEFVRHQIDDHSGVGTQFEVADVNGDGLLDVAIGNKHGAFLFEQVRD